MNAIQAFVPPAIVETFAAFLEFCYIARRNIITEGSLKQLNIALGKFHEARQVFAGTVRSDDPSAFSLPRQHSMVHYSDHIRNFGSPNGLCSSITESKHITAVKCPWRRSNKHVALPQMLKSNERLDKLAAARANFMAHGMLADSCLIQAIQAALDVLDHNDKDSMDDEDSSDDLESETNSDFFDDDTTTLNSDGATSDFHDPEPDLHNTNLNISGAVNQTTPPYPPPSMPLNHDDDDTDNDDHGPVESGPLMNEVRLMSKKGL